MRILFHKIFEKKYIKLQQSEKRKFKERKDIFLKTPFHPILNKHSLHGKYLGYSSINITGNLRAVYKLLDNSTVIFVDIDTHSNLYS